MVIHLLLLSCPLTMPIALRIFRPAKKATLESAIVSGVLPKMSQKKLMAKDIVEHVNTMMIVCLFEMILVLIFDTFCTFKVMLIDSEQCFTI